MLRPADSDLVRRDRDLPDLVLLLDSDVLTARLEQALGHPGMRGAGVTYLRYKPGRSCLAAYRAEVDGRPIDLVAKTYGTRAMDKFHRAMATAGASVTGRLGPGRFALDNTTVVVSVFPNDPKLRRLARLTAPDALARLAVGLGVHADSDATRLETLRYNPERRFVGRLMVDERDIAAVRCYTRHDYARIAAKAGALESRGPLRLPRTLTRDHRARLLAFEWQRGDLLEETMRRKTVTARTLELVGTALAHLHGQQAPELPRWTGPSEAAALVALARYVAFLHPPIGAGVGDLAQRLAARLAPATVKARPLHGDFYAKQVLANGGMAALIDLDEASLGEPAIDLARFRADLEAAVISHHLDAGEIEPLFEPLLEGYRLASGALPARLDLHVAAQLLRLTTHPFRRREAGWAEKAAAIVERARAFLDNDARSRSGRIASPRGTGRQAMLRVAPDACGSSSAAGTAPERAVPPKVVDRFGVTSDPHMPFLSRAMNPGDMAERFAQALPCLDAAQHIEILAITVTRYKPRRRCIITYDVAAHDRGGTIRKLAVVGKVRARGTDTFTHNLLQTLRTGSFGASAGDGILVPESLGLVKDVHMGVQRHVPGESLGRLLECPSGPRHARRAAEAIHKLHAVSPPADRRHTVDDEIRILREQLTDVAQAQPCWRGRVERLLEGCARIAAGIRQEPPCGIHRDFYPDQILADGDRMYLMDLDLYSEGPPALDIGNFVAHLDEHSLRRFGDPDHLADRKKIVMDRYLQISDKTTREAILSWATLSLVRHVAISRRLPERRPFTAALLDLCEERVFGGQPVGTLAWHAPDRRE